MASMLSHLFSCCLQRKPPTKIGPPNEQSHLIPAITEPTSTSMPEELVIDHQKLRERLSSIVRSKEGKMVNVNARLPFNLHNKNLSATIDASSSGSRSTSSNRPSLNVSPLSPRTPILNVRLVKKLPSDAVGIAARRGRARRKGGEDNGPGMGFEKESVPRDSGLASSDDTATDNTPRVEDFSLIRTAETSEVKPTFSVSPASTVDLILEDPGPLTVNWGD